MCAHMQKELVDDLVVATEHTETETLHIASPRKSRLLTAQNIPPALLYARPAFAMSQLPKIRENPGLGPA